MVPALQALVLVQQEVQIAADQVAEQPRLMCGHLSIAGLCHFEAIAAPDGDRPIGAVRRTGAIACGRIKGPLSSDV